MIQILITYSVGTGLILGGKSGRNMKVTTHLHLLRKKTSKLDISGKIRFT